MDYTKLRINKIIGYYIFKKIKSIAILFYKHILILFTMQL